MTGFPIPGIASEGILPALIPALMAVLLLGTGHHGGGVALALVAAAIALFFRDPERWVDAEEGDLLSPADGRVVAVDRRESAMFPQGGALRISVFMSVFDVHVNRVPADGRVVAVRHRPGGFAMAHLEEACLQNERVEIVMEDGAGRLSVMVQVAGLVARRIICRLKQGDAVRSGQRFGLICFGSRVDLYLDAAARPAVDVGDRVKAGVTVLARLR